MENNYSLDLVWMADYTQAQPQPNQIQVGGRVFSFQTQLSRLFYGPSTKECLSPALSILPRFTLMRPKKARPKQLCSRACLDDRVAGMRTVIVTPQG